MPEEKEEERKKGAAVAFTRGKYWKAQLLILFIFLSGFAFLAYFMLGKQAHKLIGADSYSELSRNSYGEKSIVKKIISYFTGEESASVEKRSGDGFSFENSSVAAAGSLEQGVSGQDTQSSSNQVTFASQGSSLSSGSRLASSLSGSLASASSGKSKTELSNFSGDSKNLAVKVSAAEKANFKNGLARQQRPSALDALKGAWKASLYGARLSSQDAAKSWTARAFDSSPESESSIQYDERMKAKLDRLNPNAIPQYLKDQNIEMDALSSAKPSDVPEFDKDNSKKEKELNASREMREKLAEQMSSGLFNSMYGNSSDNSQESESKDDDSLVSSLGIDKPESKASLGSTVTTDEYGYIRVTQDDGTIQIFDPDSGAILGCESSDAGMCYMPGAENCPSGLYFV